MAYKMNVDEIKCVKEAVRCVDEVLQAIQKESEKENIVWAPYIEEKANILIIYASLIKRIAEDAIGEG